MDKPSKKLFLLFHGRFPSEKAASLFAAKSAEAFADKGLEVVLIVPRRKSVKHDPYAYYNIRKNFSITYIPTLDLFGIPIISKAAFHVSFGIYSSLVALYSILYISKNDIVYSNESLPLFLISYFKKNIFYEMHDFPESKLWFFRVFIHRMKWILAHNNWKAKKLHELFAISPEKILCEPNAVEIKQFTLGISKEEARKKLDVPHDRHIIMYTGHLYGWKGVHTLAEAARRLPSDFLIVFVGGTDADIQHFKEKYESVDTILIVGHKPHTEIPIWQKAADVLVLPNTAKEAISQYYTSPMKLFEYMASERPIVASRIPSITEIVDDTCAFLTEPDNPELFAQSIRFAVEHPLENQAKAKQALARVQPFTWIHRVQRIMAFMNK
jgi:glycosyltransferase involved in cell wall biosynthesis